MRISRVLWVLVGSFAVSAACSASKESSSSSPASDAGRLVDAVADVVRDALGLDTSVSDAKADGPPAPTPPTVDSVTCSVERGSYVYAEKAYPGRLMDDLARSVTAVVCYPSDIYGSGYTCGTAGFSVRDGSVAFMCGAKGSTVLPASVKFIAVTP